jgi:L-amino acid N-acyltransferase YncA
MIREAVPADGPAIARIYNFYIRTSIITFEEVEIGADDIAARMATVTAAALPYLVMEEDGRIVGYAYAGKFHARSAYRHTVESTIYLDHEARGAGRGRILYKELLGELRKCPVHAVIAGVSLPNEASIALHEELGFVKVGHHPELGWKLGRWIDVGYWQLTWLMENPS